MHRIARSHILSRLCSLMAGRCRSDAVLEGENEARHSREAARHSRAGGNPATPVDASACHSRADMCSCGEAARHSRAGGNPATPVDAPAHHWTPCQSEPAPPLSEAQLHSLAIGTAAHKRGCARRLRKALIAPLPVSNTPISEETRAAILERAINAQPRGRKRSQESPASRISRLSQQRKGK